jgi:hypothetical protein
MADEVEVVGLPTLTENELIGIKTDVGRTPDYEAEVPLRKIVEKPVFTQDTF